MTGRGALCYGFAAMNFVILILVFGLVVLAAAAFVVVPLLRGPDEAGAARRPLLAAGGGLGVALVGLAAYAALGQPGIALTDLSTPAPDDYPALVAVLAQRMPDRPGDRDGWMLLGRGYMALGNPDQGAKAFARAVAIAKEQDGAAPPDLLTDYGEALSEAAGQVNDDAEAVFKEALTEDPGNLAARYYLGLALADRGDKTGALDIWEKLLADAPENVAWRSQLVNQMAMLKGQAGGAAPNPMAMVAQLASRLESNPDDLNGWLMLIRAYAVLGDREKAIGALTKAKTVFAKQADAQAALAQSAKENSLN
jgi:cytochrome c-type biogenesis protein CcmH